SASDRCHDTPAWNTPAFRNTSCTGPSANALAASPSTASALETSVGTESVSAPSSRTSSSASASACASTSASTTFMPSLPVLRALDLLVVHARRRMRGRRDPVEHQVVEELVLREGALDVAVAIGPGSELLDDPSRQSRR